MLYEHEQAVSGIMTQATRAMELSEKLARYAIEMQDDREVRPDQRMNWAINDIENFLRNINFAQLARLQAALKAELDVVRNSARHAIEK